MSDVLNSKSQELQNAASGEAFASSPAEQLAVAAARQANFKLKLNPDILYGVEDGSRIIRDISDHAEQLEHPLDAAGAPVEIQTRESYKIYNCLKNMPHCIKSMEYTRGDKEGIIGTNRPLENTICVAVHHLDDKSYGGLCVLREWGGSGYGHCFRRL